MTEPSTPEGTPARRTPTALRALAVIAALVVVPGGAFLAAANVPTGGKVAIGVAVVWWLVASAAIAKTLLKRRPDLRKPVRIALGAAAVASLVGAFVVTRPSTVDERIATAAADARPADQRDLGAEQKPAVEESPAPARNVQLLSGAFTGESGHRGAGDAAVVKLGGGGRVLTFSNFDVDPGGGGLLVYLHAGKTTSDDLGEFIELAKLKGTRGDQQYEIPAEVDLRRFSTVVIWCVPFSTRIAQAPLS